MRNVETKKPQPPGTVPGGIVVSWGFPWEMNRASLAAAAGQEQAGQTEPGEEST
jgi:hypothetical protein